MSWLKPICREIFGLFVDDGNFALMVLIWLGACGLALPRLDLPSPLAPALLFAGLVAILGLSAWRRAGARA